MKLRSNLVVALVLGAAILACVSTPGDGGGSTDSGSDAATPPLGDSGSSDGGRPILDGAIASEGGTDAGAAGDAADAAVDSSDGSIASSPILVTPGADGILDFDVDATNLYLLFVSTKIAKCPIAGCGPSGPTTLRAWSGSAEIEALDGFVHYALVGHPNGADFSFFGAVKADGTVVGDRWIVGQGAVAITNLRTDGSYVYAVVSSESGGVTSAAVRSGLIPGGRGDAEQHFAGNPFDVVGDVAVGAGPSAVRSWVGAARTDYPAVLPLPTAVAIDMDVVVALDGAKMVHFCDRTACVAWTSTATTANAIALDAAHLYFGTDTGVLRCEVAEMKTLGTCTPALVKSTGASVVQVVARNGAAYARTATSSIVRVVP